MKNINIDTEKLNDEISKIEEVNRKFDTLFKKIKDETEVSKDVWDTGTSESVFESFQQLYVALENVKQTFQKDVEFLKNAVSSTYTEEETQINKLVDEKIAM